MTTEAEKLDNLSALDEFVRQWEEMAVAVFVPDISTGLFNSDGDDCGKPPRRRVICTACGLECDVNLAGDGEPFSVCCQAKVKEVWV